jgi:nucleoside-diphosphate-sugar epimerase
MSPGESEVKADQVAGRSALVTGAAGFIGAQLTRRLLDVGFRVAALVRPTSDLWRMKPYMGSVDLVLGELGSRDSEWLGQAMVGTDFVFHLAARGVNPGEQDEEDLVRSNVLGTLQVLKQAHLAHVGRVVYCGSCLEYGPGIRHKEDGPIVPVSSYSVSKSAAWLFAQTFSKKTGLPVVGLRPFHVYGPLEDSARLIPYAVERALGDGDLHLTGGEQSRDFVFVADVVEAFLAAAVGKVASGDVFNVCSGEAVRIREVVAAVLRLTRSRASPKWGSLPYREGEIRELSGDPGRARRALAWRATTPLDEGLRRTIDWVRSASPPNPGTG